MTASTASARVRAGNSTKDESKAAPKRGGFVSQALPLDTGRVQLMRASRRNDGTTKNARDNYTTLEVLESVPVEGWPRYCVRHYGPGRYKARDLNGGKEQHIEVDQEFAQRIEAKMASSPPPMAVVGEPRADERVFGRLADIELAVHRVGDLVDALGERLDELAEAVDDMGDGDEDGADDDGEGRAANPPAGDIARQVVEMRELNAQLNATFGGPEPKLDIMAILRTGLEVLATRNQVAAQAAQNPPPPQPAAIEVDPRWVQLIQRAEAVGVTPEVAQQYLVSGLGARPAAPNER